jgi:hypothetical protein
MYRIIGADQKEYGPVSSEQLKQWINEGRVSGQTRARLETETEWKPVSAFPEFGDTLHAVPAPGAAAADGVSSQSPVEAVLGRDFDLDIGSCIVRAWDLVKQNFWPVTGVSFLIIMATLVINQVIGLAFGPAIRGTVRAIVVEHHVSPVGIFFILCNSLLGYPVYMLLTAGLFKYYLKLIRAEGPTLADAFAGFSPIAGQLMLLGLVNGILSFIAYMLCILPGVYLTVAWIFALPLVIDRKIPFWTAMELSRKVVAKHWFIVFAFLLVIGLVAACGLIVCCIGLVVTAAISSIALLYAYEDIFSRTAA